MFELVAVVINILWIFQIMKTLCSHACHLPVAPRRHVK